MAKKSNNHKEQITKLYLNDALDKKSYDSLGVWKYPNIEKFSNNKNLWWYQVKALQNAIIALNLYYKNGANNIDKRILYNECINEGLNVHSFDVNSKGKANNFDIYSSSGYYEIKKDDKDNSYIEESNFFNRMCFWMATASGKTLVLIKLIEIINHYRKSDLMPFNDFLVLLPDENAEKQFRKVVAEYNIGNREQIYLASLKDYDEKRDFNQNLGQYLVYVYRSDLLSDEEKAKKLDISLYDNNGNWYIFMDEAHKGEKDSSSRQNYITILSRNGFLFNFSATFTDPIDYATTCYNFNLEKFITNGFGKNIYISDSVYNFSKKENDLNNMQKQIEVLKSMIIFSLIKKQKKEGFYHNPIMITLVDKIKGDKSDADLFFKEMDSLAKGNLKENVLERAKNELIKEFTNKKSYAIGDEQLTYNIKEDIKKITFKNILKSIYNASKPGNIEIIEGEKGKEFVLKLVTSDIPFALFRIGQADDYLKKYKDRYQICKNYDKNKIYFSDLNGKDGQSINILIGSRMFYEGWDSNRPNVINYINIGSDDALKYVLQSIGRGIRIQPVENDVSNRQRLKENNKNKSELLETLFIFATDNKAIANIINTLKAQKGNGKGVEEKEISLKTNKNNTFDLLIPQYKKLKKDVKSLSIDSFKISKSALARLRAYFNSLSDTLIYLNYDIDNIFIKRVKVLINDDTSFIINDNYNYTDIRKLLEMIFKCVSRYDCRVEKFKILDDEIIHFKHIKVNIDKYDAISKIIKQYPFKELSEKKSSELKRLYDNKKITFEEMLEKLDEYAKKKDQTYDELTFNQISEHYYSPIITSSSEKVEYIKHIISVESEIVFINELIKYIGNIKRDKEKCEWMFSKIDQTLDEKMGMPYSDQVSLDLIPFYPDFIFWLKNGKNYKIYFVDPKGTKHTDYELKVDGFKKLFYEKDKPKVFKYNDLRITVDLILINNNPTSIGKEYRSFWRASTDFSWIF